MLTCAASDCSETFDLASKRGGMNRVYCSTTCKGRQVQRQWRAANRQVVAVDPSHAFRSARDAVVMRVAHRLAKAQRLNELRALSQFSEFELDLLAWMETAA